MKKNITYHLITSSEDFLQSKIIITEYLETLKIDLTYMNLPEEFSSMELKYTAPQGAFILAKEDREIIGCVGVRKLDTETAELKRLYVKDSHKGNKIGITLLQKALEKTRELGYNKIRLEVIPTLHKAKQLYYSIGFYDIQPYFNNHVEGTTYMEKKIRQN